MDTYKFVEIEVNNKAIAVTLEEYSAEGFRPIGVLSWKGIGKKTDPWIALIRDFPVE